MLKQLQREGYDVGMLPMDDTQLIKSVLNQTDAKFNSADLNIAYRMKVSRLTVNGLARFAVKLDACPWMPIAQRMNGLPLPISPQVDEYQKLCEYSEALEENWGKPPGQLNSNGQELLVYGKQFGNVFIGVQAGGEDELSRSTMSPSQPNQPSLTFFVLAPYLL